MQRIPTFLDAWGRKSLGAMIRDWWHKQPQKPTSPQHPWSDEIQAEVERPDAIRICHRCLTPQQLVGWFCPKCGAATGPYNNCMPCVYVFSTGEVLRAGVDPQIRFAHWVRPVYWIVGAFEYLIFAPIYWVRLLRAQKGRRENVSEIDNDSEL